MTGLDDAAGDAIARARRKRRRLLVTGIALTLGPTLISRMFFALFGQPTPVRHRSPDAVNIVLASIATVAVCAGLTLVARAAVAWSRTNRMQKILETTSWTEYPARPSDAPKNSVEVEFPRRTKNLLIVASGRRLAAQVRESHRLELARPAAAGMLVARVPGGVELFLARENLVWAGTPAVEPTEGQVGDVVVVLVLRGSRRVTHVSKPVTRRWKVALTFTLLVAASLAIAAAATAPDPLDAFSARATWTHDRAIFDVLKIACLMAVGAVLVPLVGLARSSYRRSGGTRRDRAVRRWIKMLLGWWVATLSVAVLLALLNTDRQQVDDVSVMVGGVLAVLAVVLDLLALRGPARSVGAGLASGTAG